MSVTHFTVGGLLRGFYRVLWILSLSPRSFSRQGCVAATGVTLRRGDYTMPTPNRSGWVVLAMSTGAKAVTCAITEY